MGILTATFYDALYAILNVDASNYTNYGAKPAIVKDYKEQSKSDAPFNGLSIREENARTVTTYNNQSLFEEQMGIVSIWSKNRESRDNLELDVKTIYEASNDSGHISSIKRTSRFECFSSIVQIKRISN